ncbi:MAG: hypothetical protein K6F28_08200 [Lachnospiraceae bacterium]|nr:hypothetical protein [Lachnospiraceae bacterium]
MRLSVGWSLVWRQLYENTQKGTLIRFIVATACIVLTGCGSAPALLPATGAGI